MAPPGRKPPLLVLIVKSHDFARDLTVTTLGVLIALGIGEVVDEIRWKFRVAAAEAAMDAELGLVHGAYTEKVALQPCLNRRLSEVAEIVATARETGRLPDIKNISNPPDHGSFGDSWQLALSSDIPLHIDNRKLMRIATIWANARYFAEAAHRERDAFDRLALLEGHAGKVSQELLDEADKQLTEAQAATDASSGIGERDGEMLARNGIPAMLTETKALDSATLKKIVSGRNVCRPMLVDGKPYRLKGPVRTARLSTAS